MKINFITKIILFSFMIAGFLLAGCMNSLENALDEGDTQKIIKIYNKANTEDEKKEICAQINNYTLAWFKELVEYSSDENIKKTPLYNISQEDLEKCNKKLKFLDYIEDERLLPLKLIKECMDRFNSNEKELHERYPDAEEMIDYGDNPVENLDIYVNSRVRNSDNIKVANINVNDEYLDEYLVSSYIQIYDNIVPTDDWQAVVRFNSSEIDSGVMNINAVKVDERVFQNAKGFEKKLPVYCEVGDQALEYADFMCTYRSIKEDVIANINKIIKNHEKFELKISENNEKEKKDFTKEERMLYGFWHIIDGDGMVSNAPTLYIGLNQYICEDGQYYMHSLNIEYNALLDEYQFSFIVENDDFKNVKGTLYQRNGNIYMTLDLGSEFELGNYKKEKNKK